MPIEKIGWDKQDIVSCDERGRATLGSEYANDQVLVYIAETADMDEIQEWHEPSDREKEELGKMYEWAEENVENWFDLHPDTGIVVDKYGEEYQSPHGLDNDE